MQTALIAFIAFVVTAVSGRWLIPLLHRLNFGQTILDIGPSWHKNKEGTPTMGGLMFIMGTALACVAGFFLIKDAGSAEKVRFSAGLLMALGFAFLGFMDDYIKVVKKRNLGLSAGQKLAGQILLAAAYLVGLYLTGTLSTTVPIPFLGQINLGVFYYPFAVFVIVGAVNAVNLTDGIDGLCSAVTFVSACGFMVMSTLLSYTGVNYMAAALAGGCIGFLFWNHHPAKVFMGDTGSLFLGGMISALAFGINNPVILIFAGIVYVLETLSDILQIAHYKMTHRRIFKMAPIHHHFEMCGWSEWKIVIVFSIVQLLGAAVSVLAIKAL
ncbi:MAG TPA: phospho-N-acetylmuramoyl-pentapeptide-transferase [Oscillospiraceae bacterium]|nr:phospho-N-acetylmuramoyl-pentapeptide-transferase [Oscillospiraceae bacterium]HXK77552.1 phospho-N-acetylmuramoyl-pentapeptide-transferase [Oscillospiraceae bacterium]